VGGDLRGYDMVRDFSLPTIAVIDGLCIGGGNNLALAGDTRLASFLNALRAANMPTLLAIRDTIRQVR
jgi:enoyl-CoA hydratase/carnithine racemase